MGTDVPLMEKGQSEASSRRTPRARWLRPTLLSLALALGLLVVVGGRSCLRPSLQPKAPGGMDTHDMVLASMVPTALTAPTAPTTSEARVLECFQVAQPVLEPAETDETSCSVTLMEHVFAFSYGHPFVGEYVPPRCDFNRVVMNFTVVSEGRQFDRLALMFLNDTEVWRTSTAEPVVSPGIRWEYHKDMTAYLSLWKAPQKVIFDLGNLVSETYTGSFNTTLTLTFFSVPITDGEGPSDVVIPISAQHGASNGPSHFTLPADNATSTVAFPRNARRAVFSVSAIGQAAEEFWWSNVLQSDVGAFAATAGQLAGLSPFREVQVYIDGRLAGVQWPFPVVFTGGVVPGLHRPVVGIDVFDLREHEMNITAWLPLLCDGDAHTFTIAVAGLADDGNGMAALTATVGSSWFVSGKVFVWLDDEASGDSGTTGATGTTDTMLPTMSLAPPTIRVDHVVQQDAKGANETLEYEVTVSRALHIKAAVTTANGTDTVMWMQTLQYTNRGRVGAYGFTQGNVLHIRGTDVAIAGGAPVYRASYHYLLDCNTTTSVSATGNLTLWAAMDQGLELRVAGRGVFATGLEAFADRAFAGGSVLRTRFNGTAGFTQYGDRSRATGYGSTSQALWFDGLPSTHAAYVPLYYRSVEAVNTTIVRDQIVAGGEAQAVVRSVPVGGAAAANVYAPVVQQGTGPRVFLGRHQV